MPIRVMVYSHDTFGLGNIRRMLAISEHLLESLDDVSVLLVTGSPMVHSFRLRAGLDYIKLPCLSRVGNDEYSVKSLGTGIEQLMQLRAGVILSASRDFDPDIVLVDKKPDGVKHELQKTLTYLRAKRPQCRLSLVLRDILDAPESTVAQWQARGYESIIRQYFDSVLILGSPDVFDAVGEYRFSTHLRRLAQYTGYICKQANRDESVRLRSGLLQDGNRRLVVVTPGGGEDGFNLVRNYVAGLQHLRDVHSVIVCGPEMPLPQRESIAQQLQGASDVTLMDFSGDMMSLMGAADAVVSMAGYNTICEILALRKRAVIVPRVRPVQEQWIRAERLAKLGLVRMIHPDELTPERLAAAVKAQIERPGHSLPPLAHQHGLAGVTQWVEQNAPQRSLAAAVAASRIKWTAASLT